MRRSHMVLALAFAASARAYAQSPGPGDLVTRAATAMGGESALRAVGTVTYNYYYAALGIGQSELPESPPRLTVSYGRLIHDYRGMRRAFVQQNQLVAGSVQRQRQVVTPSMGLNDLAGVQTPLTAATVNGQQRLMRLAPERLILSALDNAATLTPLAPRTLRGAPADGVRLTATDTVDIWFDRTTGLPLVTEQTTDDPILGDRVTQVWFTRWQSAGAGVLTPRQQDVFVNGQLNQALYAGTVAVNAAVSDTVFDIPDSIARRAPATLTAPPAPQAITLVQLGTGVWRAEGATHHSLVVEQPDQLVIVEAPLGTERVRALLDTLRVRFPGKRVGVAVMTHYHWDHAGGIREIVAENIPIATMEANAAFVRQVAAARRTIRPDLQAQRRRSPVLRTFTDSMVIGSGESMVVLYRQPSTHVEGLLSAWVPSARVLFTSDVVNPGAQGQVTKPGCAELVALARARNLGPERYAGGHGVLVPWPDIERAASQP